MASLLEQPAEARTAWMRVILEAEAAGNDAEMARFIATRLRALSTLPVDDATSLMELFAEAERGEAAAVGMRRFVGLQNGCRLLTLDEVRHIEPFLPRVRQLAGLGAGEAKQPSPEPAATRAEPERRQRRWAIWRLFSRP